MNRRHFATLLAWALIAVFATVGCGQTAPPPTAENNPEATASSPEPVSLTVSAAASVQDALQEIQAAYQSEAPNVTITYNFGSSGSLAQQISQGAPADVFLSASAKWMDDLAEKGEILTDSRKDLLHNTLVLIVPKNKTGIADFQDLETEAVGKVAMGEPESVPAGTYAQEVLTSLNLVDALRSKLVYGKDVRQVLSYVATGNVDAGLVYASDAKTSDQVQVIATAAADTHSPITYPVAVVSDSPNASAAQAFVDFLSTEPAVEIFAAHGFTVAE